MTNLGFSSWQASRNASPNVARYMDWARQSTADAHRMSRGYSHSRGWRIANVIAALVVIGVLVVAAPFVLAILSVGF
ncbi:hypothetical protein [Nocardia sp. NPDC052112]|uniref:hypothetical protein n=1 Tax=Nocardia sp. NPDC052112 TaxID=3155646 RepID=UPI00343F6686